MFVLLRHLALRNLRPRAVGGVGADVGDAVGGDDGAQNTLFRLIVLRRSVCSLRSNGRTRWRVGSSVPFSSATHPLRPHPPRAAPVRVGRAAGGPGSYGNVALR